MLYSDQMEQRRSAALRAVAIESCSASCMPHVKCLLCTAGSKRSAGKCRRQHTLDARLFWGFNPCVYVVSCVIRFELLAPPNVDHPSPPAAAAAAAGPPRPPAAAHPSRRWVQQPAAAAASSRPIFASIADSVQHYTSAVGAQRRES